MISSGVYEIRNITDNKCYIGSAINTRLRWNRHVSALRLNKHYNAHLQYAWNKYGEDNFEFRVLLRCHDKDLLILEQAMMDVNLPEYNMCPLAISPKGYRHSEEARRNMSIGHRSYQTEETRQKISNTLKGYKRSKENRRNISMAKMGIKHPQSRLTDKDVLEIRRLYATGKIYQRILGKMFKISRSHVNSIIKRKYWKHI